MSGSQIEEKDLSDFVDAEPIDHRIRVLELQIAIAKEKHALRELEEMERQRKLKQLGYNPALDNNEFPSYNAGDFSE